MNYSRRIEAIMNELREFTGRDWTCEEVEQFVATAAISGSMRELLRDELRERKAETRELLS